jgi:hypothetical protein
VNEIDVTSEWAEWADCHSAEDQKKRLDSARTAACTPVLVDKENVFAYFQSDRGKYETFLDRCDCTDFKRRKRPCKHMYRLALELGLVEGPFSSYLHGGYSWKQAVEIVEAYPENIQREFFEHLYTACKSSEPYRRKKCPEIETLITGGLLLEYPEKETPKFKTVRVIEDFLMDKQRLKTYFSRKFSPPSYFNGVEMVPDELPDDDVTAFLRERGFVK